MRRGVRVAAPLFPAAFALGASFGVLARTAHFGAVAAVVMSATTFAGSAQVATVSVLGAGGGVAAAVVAALLLNARYAPIGITIASSFRGSILRRFAQAQLVVDESWALAGGGTPRFDRRVLLGVGWLLWVGWVGGTAVGALLGQAIGDPSAFGLDGAFAALFVALARCAADHAHAHGCRGRRRADRRRCSSRSRRRACRSSPRRPPCSSA